MKHLFLFLLFFIACSQNSSTIETLEKPRFEKLLSKSLLLIDVRTPLEFNSGSIDGAVNVDYNAPDFMEKIASFPKDQPVLVYCGSGLRSGLAAKAMDSLGFVKIYDLKGGYLKWQGY
ncbi:MAG: rhodanese-like domain-containing protein [Flavobacteriaceae bacterium]